jgi:hypothetical protein
MNKRILDGAGLWKSDKLARIQPEWMRAEYANWIPLALANGAFEVDTRRIWATVYSYNRPDISFDDAEEIKREFCRVGLLFLWPDEESGKAWAYFVGIERTGRLPSKSRLDKKHEPIGPTPPADALRSYVESTRTKPLDSVLVSQWLANGCLGFGLGTGIGKGEKKAASPPVAQAPPSLSFTGQHLVVSTRQDAILREAFPWIDRPAEYRKADSWLEANPERLPKKTNRFLHNWFSRITQPKGVGNAKDVNAAVATTMQGAAINSGITH